MIIEKIRIKHFKSIIDSGDIYLEPDLTILAGKNETGKTTVLEVLHMFNNNGQDPIDVAPINIDRPETQISITFILTQQEVNIYFARAKKPKPEPMIEPWKVTLTRHFITKALTQKYQTIDNESKTFLGFGHTALFDGETQRTFETTEKIFKSMLELYT
jgi:predicted ATP-dependent endonuclease of OLD family